MIFSAQCFTLSGYNSHVTSWRKPLSVFIVLFLLLCLCSSCYTFRATKPMAFLNNHFRPVFRVPACDIKNPLETVYFSFKAVSADSVVEISLVFKDEDQPFFLADAGYDAFRRIKYHRKKDIETLYIHFNAVSGLLKCIDFGDTYSGNQNFSRGIVKHFHAVIQADQIMQEEGRPVLYINTWNHLFSEKDTNPDLPKTSYLSYTCVEGSRKEAEPCLRFRKRK